MPLLAVIVILKDCKDVKIKLLSRIGEGPYSNLGREPYLRFFLFFSSLPRPMQIRYRFLIHPYF